MTTATDLASRFRGHLLERSPFPPGRPVAVALSGGRDSVVLLHLMRFAVPDLVPDVRAIHVDHRMRHESAADARWVAGLCRAWRVPLESGALPEAPADENAARALRYAFLRRAAARAGGAVVATAHHADDQAETVLFRLARGAGPAGLVGIRERVQGVVRPLLGFSRDDLARYAGERRISWREDASNRDRRRARNALRLDVLPALEGAVPGSARALARLAGIAADEERVWKRLLDAAEGDLDARRERAGWSLARPILRSYDRALRARLLRRFAARLGGRIRASALRRALAFVDHGGSGKGVDLGSGLRLERAFDRLHVVPAGGAGEVPPGEADAETIAIGGPVTIEADTCGTGHLIAGGRRIGIDWHFSPGTGGDEEAPRAASADGAADIRLDPGALRFPLRLRPALPGDRLRMPYGRKRVVTLLAEREVPRADRRATTVLVDARDEPVWVPGIGRAAASGPREGEPVLNVRVWDEREG